MTRHPPLSLLRDSALEAAQKAGRVLLKHYGRKLRVSEKNGAGLVTNADLEAEETTLKLLRKATPDFGFLTEESSPTLSSSPGRWIVDPLDGTTNYVHGFPMFCVSIACEWNREMVVGVIHHPVLKETYLAVKGKGATLNGKKIRVSKTTRLEDALLTTGFTYRKEQFLDAEMDTFERLSRGSRAVRRPGSAALDLAYTARGVFDAFWERRLSPWDVAAGVLLVTEAGGKVTGFQGQPFQVNQSELLASNSLLHDSLLSAVVAP